MQILKGKSKVIVRIIGAQILMMIFGLSVTLPTQNNTFLMVAANILSAGLYFFLIYTFMHTDGQRDAVKVKKLPASKAKMTGLAVMTAANLLNVLLLLTLLIGQVIRLVSNVSETLNSFVGVIYIILRFLYSVFLGFSILINPVGSINPLIFIAYIIIPILVGIIGYHNGLRGYSVLEKLGLAPDNNEDKSKN